jgi:hypothetical protein
MRREGTFSEEGLFQRRKWVSSGARRGKRKIGPGHHRYRKIRFNREKRRLKEASASSFLSWSVAEW